MKNLTFLILLLAPVLLFSAPSDVTGYKDIKWGDNKKKVSDVFYKSEYNEKFYAITEYPHYIITLNDVNSPIDEIKINFYLDQAFSVTINYKKIWVSDYIFFDVLSKRLVRDFGDKFIETNQITSLPGENPDVVYYRNWNFKSTTVTLSWSKGKNDNNLLIKKLLLKSVPISEQIEKDKLTVLENKILY